MPALQSPSGVSLQAIQVETARHFGVSVTDLRSGGRHPAHAHPRAVAVYLARAHLGLSYPVLGRAFGGRDHSTALWAVRKVARLLETDIALQVSVAEIRRQLRRCAVRSVPVLNPHPVFSREVARA